MSASDQEDAILPLVRNVIATRYDDLPAEARDIAKKCVIDTLGVTIAGSTAQGCDTIASMAKEWGGHQESTILAYGEQVPSPNAAWVNATMARARDLDDYDSVTAEHPSVSTVTTALAISELVGGVSGKEAITAITLGADLSIRIRSAFKVKAGMSPWVSSSFSVFPSAAVAGKLLGLDEDQMLNAMGLALCQVSNTIQGHQEGALSVRVHHGIGVRAGLLSALMAEKGITGPHYVLEGKFGLYPIYGQNKYDRDILLAELGKQFLNTRISTKPWPCCGAAYGVIEGTLQLVQEYDIHPEDVDEIIVNIDQTAYAFTFEPGEEKRSPQTVPAAQFSIPYTVGTAVVYRDVTLDNFTEEGIKDEKVLEIARKVNAVVKPELTATPSAQAPSLVEIRTSRGKFGPRKIDYVKGSPQNPMTLEECIEKFRKCLNFSVKPLPKENTEEVIDMVKGLEDVSDIARIARLLA